MQGPSESNEGVPTLSLADYINRLEIHDAHSDRQRSRGPETLEDEFYGQLDGWEPETHRFVHDIVTTRLGLRLFTRAVLDSGPTGEKRFLNSPEAVDCYELWIKYGENIEKIYINSTDRALAREIHDAFFRHLMETGNIQETIKWLFYHSEYSATRCQKDASIPLIDFMPKSARILARKMEGG